MVSLTKHNLFLGISVLSLLAAQSAFCAEIDTNTAQMQAMDKITGQVSIIEIPVNSHKKFGSFDILVRACKTRSPEDTPENFAFVDVVDDYNQKPLNIFRGWMVSSSPALNPIEHPIYDVWLLKCINTDVNPKSLLSAEELKARDLIERANLDTQANKLKKDIDALEKENHHLENINETQNIEQLPLPEAIQDEPEAKNNLESKEPVLQKQTSDTWIEGDPRSLLNFSTGDATNEAEKDNIDNSSVEESGPDIEAIDKELSSINGAI